MGGVTSAKRIQSISGTLRQSFALSVGNVAAFASRVTGRGTGASIKGALITRLDPGAFARLVSGKRIAVVSGTNGKTTTTHLLTACLLYTSDAADE